MIFFLLKTKCSSIYALMTQADALKILKTGVNVFLTGEPGAGKSYTVREYVKFLYSRGITPALTASTGIAATHIGGMTIHSWSGLGIRKHVTRRDCKDLEKNANLKRRIKNTSVLIIDEISMLDAAMLDSIDLICRVMKDIDLPFGGIQVVFVGDFFQLPPISRPDEPPVYFAFESNAWRAAGFTVCYLSEQHRQEDKTFLDLLSAMRRANLTENHLQHLHNRKRPAEDTDITKLYSHNADVDRMNSDRLRALKGNEQSYSMSTHGNPKLIEQIIRGCLSPEKLTLKIGARVMFTRNNPSEGYVNGSLGEVVDFDKEKKYPVVQLKSGRVICTEPETWSIDVDGSALAAVRQIPLRLAWAITVHKSQGMSLDGAFIDLGSAFAYGQGYVALSRVRSLSGLYLGGLNTRALEIDPTVLTKDEIFRELSLEAEQALAHRSEEQLITERENFIKACGGKKETLPKETLDAFSVYFSAPPKKKKGPKWESTLELILEKKNVHEVAKARERTVGTIIEHLIEIQELKKLPENVFAEIQKSHIILTTEVHPIMKKLGPKILRPIFEFFQGEYSYDDLKIAKWLYESVQEKMQ